MARAYPQNIQNGSPTGQLTILAFPLDTYKVLSDEAARRGLTPAQALQEAIGSWLKKGK